jgi:hypothetical protein
MLLDGFDDLGVGDDKILVTVEITGRHLIGIRPNPFRGEEDDPSGAIRDEGVQPFVLHGLQSAHIPQVHAGGAGHKYPTSTPRPARIHVMPVLPIPLADVHFAFL